MWSPPCCPTTKKSNVCQYLLNKFQRFSKFDIRNKIWYLIFLTCVKCRISNFLKGETLTFRFLTVPWQTQNGSVGKLHKQHSNHHTHTRTTLHYALHDYCTTHYHYATLAAATVPRLIADVTRDLHRNFTRVSPQLSHRVGDWDDPIRTRTFGTIMY